jgi:hypothetical protein
MASACLFVSMFSLSPWTSTPYGGLKTLALLPRERVHASGFPLSLMASAVLAAGMHMSSLFSCRAATTRSSLSNVCVCYCRVSLALCISSRRFLAQECRRSRAADLKTQVTTGNGQGLFREIEGQVQFMEQEMMYIPDRI